MPFRVSSIAAVLARGAALWAGLSMPAFSAERSDLPPNTCDRLAGDPADTGRPAGVAGVPFDLINSSEAVQACRVAMAARGDDARTVYQLGRALARTGNALDARESARLYKVAADQGFAPALTSLGYLYASGLGGLPRSEPEAVRLFRLAADQAFPLGHLGTAYASGVGGLAKDEQEATRLCGRWQRIGQRQQ
jgi:TPR repeat protein